jgi:hypothetical protein
MKPFRANDEYAVDDFRLGPAIRRHENGMDRATGAGRMIATEISSVSENLIQGSGRDTAPSFQLEDDDTIF